MPEYYSLFDQFGLVHQFIDPSHHSQGGTLFPFNLTSDMRSFLSRELLPPRHGPMTVDIGFEKVLDETVVLLVYMVYDQVISVTGENAFLIEEQF